MKRKDLDQWAAIAGHAQMPRPKRQDQTEAATSPDRRGALVLLRDHPTIRRLEDMLLLRGSEHKELVIAEASKEIFGISDYDTLFVVPEGIDELPWNHPARVQAEQRWREHEDQFETHDNLTDDEVMEIMSELGVDFSDDRGQPLRCTKHLARVAEAAARGIMGKLPDQTAAWEDRLSAEAAAFLRTRGRPK